MIKVLILDKFSYQTYPEHDGMIKISNADAENIGKTKCFDVENQKVIDYTPEQA